MAQSSTLNIGETFVLGSRIGFGSLDFITTTTSELRLTDSDVLATTSVEGLARSAARSKAEK
jgi:hypothetical protein